MPKITNLSSREDVLEAVKDNGLMLQYASEELKSDCEIVHCAVKENGFALRYAAEELKAGYRSFFIIY